MRVSIRKALSSTLTLFSVMVLIGLISTSNEIIQPVALNQVNNSIEKQSYIIKAKEYKQLLQLTEELGLTPSHKLKLINSIAIELTVEQLENLRQQIDIKVTDNTSVKMSNWNRTSVSTQPLAVIPSQLDATLLHYFFRNYGQSVTVGYLDTGLTQMKGLSHDLYGYDKAWGTYDAINDVAYNIDREKNGHGTHIASVSNNSNLDQEDRVYGIAPNAASVSIKAFDAEGKGSYADVIRGIEWAIDVKDQINLRVLNMSFSGPVMSYYWDDPLNQAVMHAWNNGIVVVASAGNNGPEPMTIGVPGNVPYVITVGAMTDSYTPYNKQDDVITSFSAAGPTIEGFVKPEVIAPGGHIAGLMTLDSELATAHPEYHNGNNYFEMSGTSQASSVVSGIVALMLTNNPNLTPNQVKCKLISGAHAATNDEGELAYSVFQQGAGLVNAFDAVLSNELDCANQDMDINADLAGEQHYFGPADINEDGNFFVTDMPGSTWYVADGVSSDGGFLWKTSLDTDGGFLWKTNFDTSGGFLWKTSFETNGGFLWKTNFEVDGGFLWKTTFDTDGGFLWKTNVEFDQVQQIAINTWVEE